MKSADDKFRVRKCETSINGTRRMKSADDKARRKTV